MRIRTCCCHVGPRWESRRTLRLARLGARGARIGRCRPTAGLGAARDGATREHYDEGRARCGRGRRAASAGSGRDTGRSRRARMQSSPRSTAFRPAFGRRAGALRVRRTPGRPLDERISAPDAWGRSVRGSRSQCSPRSGSPPSSRAAGRRRCRRASMILRRRAFRAAGLACAWRRSARRARHRSLSHREVRAVLRGPRHRNDVRRRMAERHHRALARRRPAHQAGTLLLPFERFLALGYEEFTRLSDEMPRVVRLHNTPSASASPNEAWITST